MHEDAAQLLLRHLFAQPAHQIRVGKAGSQGVYADAHADELARHLLRGGDHGRLGGAIVQAAVALDAGDAGDVDHRAAFVSRHEARGQAADLHHGEEVHVHDAVHVLGGGHLKHAVLAHDAGVVDQHVKGLLVRHHLAERLLERRRVGQLAVDGLDPYAVLSGGPGQPRLKARVRRAGEGPHVGPLAGEHLHHRRADAARRAGNQRVLSFQEHAIPPPQP